MSNNNAFTDNSLLDTDLILPFQGNDILDPAILAKRLQLAQKTVDKQQIVKRKELTARLRQQTVNARSRSFSELTNDFKTTLYGGANTLATMVYGAANIAAMPGVALKQAITGEYVPSLDESITNISGGALGFQALADFGTRNEEDYSPVAQASIASAAEFSAARDAGEAARYDQRIADGKGFIRASTEEIIGDIGSAIQGAYENPVATVNSVLEAIPSILGGGVAGKLTQSIFKGNLAKRTSKKVAEKFLQTSAGREAIRNTGEKGAIAYNMALEGITAGANARTEILRMAAEDIDALREGSPYFQQLEQEFGTDIAVQKLADKGLAIATAISATISGVATKYSGAGDFEGNFFNADSKFGKAFLGIIGRVGQGGAVGAASEAKEEAIQGAGGAFASNVAKKYTTNPDQDLSEGLTEAATTGAIIGGLAGASLGGASEVPKVALDGVKKAKGIVDKIKDKINNAGDIRKQSDSAKEAVKSGDFRDITDEDNANFDREDAISALLDPKGLPEDVKAREEHLRELDYHLDKTLSKAEEIGNKVINDKDSTKEEKDQAKVDYDAVNKRVTRQRKQLDELKGINQKDTLDEREVAAEVLIQAEKTDKFDTEEVQNSVAILERSFFNSAEGMTKKEAEAIKNSKATIDKPIRILASKRLDTLKSMEDVSDDIIKDNPSSNYIGVETYQRRITESASKKDSVKTRDRYIDLLQFKTEREKRLNTIKKGYEAFNKIPKTSDKKKKAQLKRVVGQAINELSSGNKKKFVFLKSKDNAVTGTAKIIKAATNEVLYMTAALVEARATIDVAFSGQIKLPSRIGKSVREQDAQRTDVTETVDIATKEVQDRIVTALESINVEEDAVREEEVQAGTRKFKGNVNKYIKKEQDKAQIATQFIGEGAERSATDRYRGVYEEEGLANTGKYQKEDIVFVASNGIRNDAVPVIQMTDAKSIKDRKPILDSKGKLQLSGKYKNIDKVIEAGASIVADTGTHLAKGSRTREYNVGEVQLEQYLLENGYERGAEKIRTGKDKGKSLHPGLWTKIPETTATEKDIANNVQVGGRNKSAILETRDAANKDPKQTNAIFAGRNGINSYGSPFSTQKTNNQPGGVIKQFETDVQAVQAYRDWLERGTIPEGIAEDKLAELTERRNYILKEINSGDHIGETILTHSTANVSEARVLNELINSKRYETIGQTKETKTLTESQQKEVDIIAEADPIIDRVIEEMKSNDQVSSATVEAMQALKGTFYPAHIALRYEEFLDDPATFAAKEDALAKKYTEFKKDNKKTATSEEKLASKAAQVPKTTQNRALDHILSLATKHLPNDPVVQLLNKKIALDEEFSQEEIKTYLEGDGKSKGLIDKLADEIVKQRDTDAASYTKIVADPSYSLSKELFANSISSATIISRPIPVTDPETGKITTPDSKEVAGIHSVLGTLFDPIGSGQDSNNLLEKHNDLFKAIKANPQLLANSGLEAVDQLAIPDIIAFNDKFVEEFDKLIKGYTPQYLRNSSLNLLFNEYPADIRAKIDALVIEVNKLHEPLQDKADAYAIDNGLKTKKAGLKDESLTDEAKRTLKQDIQLIEAKIKDIREPLTTARAEITKLTNSIAPSSLLSPNIKSTFAMVAMNYIATGGRKTIQNTEEGINLLLQRDEKHDVTGAEWAMFGYKGNIRSGIVNSTGGEAVSAVGFVAKDDADGRVQAKMETAVGGMIVATLQNMQYLKAKNLTAAQMNKFLAEDKQRSVDSKETVEFLRIPTIEVMRKVSEDKYDSYPEPSPEVAQIIESISASDNVLTKLFKIKSRVKKMTQEAPKLSEKNSDGTYKNPAKLRGTNQNQATKQQEIVEKHGQQELVFKQTLDILEFLESEQVWEIQGLDVDYEKTAHSTEHLGIKGKNLAIIRSHEDLMDFLEEVKGWPDGKKSSFYAEHFAARNTRVHQVANQVDTQADKHHRHYVGIKSHLVTIDPKADHPFYGVGWQIDQFFSALAEPLGFSPDKALTVTVVEDVKAIFDETREQGTDESNEDFEKGIDNAKILNIGIKAIQAVNKGATKTLELQRAIVDAAAVGGKNAASIDALQAYANYEAANGGSFQTDLFREIDGVTNGVAIGLIELAAAPDFDTMRQMLERTGLFMENEGNGKYEDYASYLNNPGNNDSYQDMAISWSQYLAEYKRGLKGDNKKWLTELDSFVTNMTEMRNVDGYYLEKATQIGRALAKDPLMITNYGAAIAKVKDQFSEKIIKSIYAEIVDAANRNDQDELTDILKRLTVIVNNGATKKPETTKSSDSKEGKDSKKTKNSKTWIKAKWNTKTKKMDPGHYKFDAPKKSDKKKSKTPAYVVLPDLTVANAINWKIPKTARANIVEKITLAHGSALQKAINSKFSVFIEKRQELVDTSKIAYEAFRYIYDNELDKKMMEKAHKVDPKATKGIELSRNELIALADELLGSQPLFRPFFATELNENILVMKSENVAQVGNNDYKTNLEFNNNITVSTAKTDDKGNIVTDSKGQAIYEDKTRKNMQLWSPKHEFLDGGLSGAIMSIHAIDSAVMMQVLAKFEALNVHDAAAFNILEALEGTLALNESFHDVVTTYSIRKEMEDMLIRTVDSLKAYDTKQEAAGTPTNFVDKLSGRLATKKTSYTDDKGNKRTKSQVEELDKANGYLGFRFTGWAKLQSYDDINAFETRNINLGTKKKPNFVDQKKVETEGQSHIESYIANFQEVTKRDQLFRDEIFKAVTHWHQYSSGQGGVFKTPNAEHKFDLTLFKTPSEVLAEKVLKDIAVEVKQEVAEEMLYELLNSLNYENGTPSEKSLERLTKYIKDNPALEDMAKDLLDNQNTGSEAKARQRKIIAGYLAHLANDPSNAYRQEHIIAYMVALSKGLTVDEQRQYVEENTRGTATKKKEILDKLFEVIDKKFGDLENFYNMFGPVRSVHVRPYLGISPVANATLDQVTDYIRAYHEDEKAHKQKVKDSSKESKKSVRNRIRFSKFISARLAKGDTLKQAFESAANESWVKDYEAASQEKKKDTPKGHLEEYAKLLREQFPELNKDFVLIAPESDNTKKLLKQVKNYDTVLDRNNKPEHDRAILAWVQHIEDSIENLDPEEAFDAIDQQRAMLRIAKIIGEEAVANLRPDGVFDRLLKNKGDRTPVVDALESFANKFGRNLGSSKEKLKGKDFVERFTRHLSGANVSVIFEEMGVLGNVTDSASHEARLRALVTDVIAKVIDPISHKRQQNFYLRRKNEGDTTLGEVSEDNDMYMITALGAQHVSTKMSARETYSHELVHITTKEAVEQDTWAARELRKLYEEVRTHKGKDGKATITFESFLREGIKIGDNNYKEELALATDRYNYIFGKDIVITKHKYKDSFGKTQIAETSNAHHEFLASGTTNEAFMKAIRSIKGVTKLENAPDASMLDKLITFFKNILNRLTARITGTANITADKRLEMLFRQLSGLEKEKISGLEVAYTNFVTPVSKAVTFALKGLLLPPKLLLNSKLIQKSRFRSVRKLGGAIQNAHHTRWEDHIHNFDTVYSHFKTEEVTLTEGLMNEFRGSTDDNEFITKLARRSNMVIDQGRKQIETNVIEHLTEIFDDLSKKEKVALTKGILKPDLQIFHERGIEENGTFIPPTFTGKELVKLYEKNSTFLQKELDSRINRLRKNYPAGKNWYTRMAINLGTWMATGNTKEDFTLLNAHNIATAKVTKSLKINDKDLPKLINLIEEISTLQAIKDTADSHKRDIIPVIEREFAKPDERNGILFSMALHKRLRDRAQDEIFGGQPEQMIKGYTKEIYNPNITFLMAPGANKDELKKLGFEQGSRVTKDEHDPNKGDALFMYVSKRGLSRSMMAGVISYTSDRAKGATLLDVHAQMGDVNPALSQNIDLKDVQNDKARVIASIVAGRTSTKKPNAVSLIPIVNGNGTVTTYRYIMNEINKDTVLEKNNDFFKILGSMEGAIVDKKESKILNDDTIVALHNDYKKNYAKHKDGGYFKIGPTVSNKRWREAYQMLPAHTRRKIRSVWGSDDMYVPRSIAPIVFGFRKLGFSGLTYTKDPTSTPSMKMIGNLLNDLFTFLLNRPIPIFLEQVWQETVSYVKNAIVIKSGAILAGNVISNAIILKIHGLSWKEIFKYHAEALIHAKQYKRDQKEIDRLQRSLDLIPSLKGKEDIERRINALKASITRNPVKQLIEEGIHQTITEDLALNDNDFSYRSRLLDKIEDNPFAADVIKAIPSPIKAVGRELFMTDSSSWYKMMKDMTQMSDFASRYAMHKFNTSKGMKYSKSVNQIIKFFINYDLPTHPAIQYANDMGVFMFSKFAFRIQAVIVNQAIEHPEKVLGLILLENLLGIDIESIFDAVATPAHLMNKVNLSMWEIFENLWTTPLFTGAIHKV